MKYTDREPTKCITLAAGVRALKGLARFSWVSSQIQSACGPRAYEPGVVSLSVATRERTT